MLKQRPPCFTRMGNVDMMRLLIVKVQRIGIIDITYKNGSACSTMFIINLINLA